MRSKDDRGVRGGRPSRSRGSAVGAAMQGGVSAWVRAVLWVVVAVGVIVVVARAFPPQFGASLLP